MISQMASPMLYDLLIHLSVEMFQMKTVNLLNIISKSRLENNPSVHY